MNREILFKAKRIDNGEWVEGLVTKIENTFCLIREYGSNISYECDVNTLCQYTGLTDKNGNKIWENDIVHNGNYFIVKWNNQCARFDLVIRISNCSIPIGRWEPMIIDWKAPKFSDYRTSLEIEVIGNIFDNPELFKGSEGNE